jgi:glycosyltransferase involved in cell wall biosynthesis
VGLAPDEKWFAFLGTIEPRKNVTSLLDAYSSLRSSLGDSAPRLLLSGSRGWDRAALSRLDRLERSSGVELLGYQPVERLSAFLGGSVAVIYPSLGEGFGLPVLEAMACGATVITTNRLAIPEVGGDAVIYTDVSAEAIRAAMEKVVASEADGADADLGAKALRRSRQFTWEEMATRHVDAYRVAENRA